MSLSEQTLRALQTLIAQNKELLVQIQATDDAAHAAAVVAQAAKESGITVSQTELVSHFLTASRSAADHALSDQQLEAVAGGVDEISEDDAMVAMSICTLGIGCAVFSIGQAAGAFKAGKKFC